MRVAATGSILSAMLATGVPVGAELPLMPCDGCQLAQPHPHFFARSRPLVVARDSASSYEDLFHPEHSAAKGSTDRWVSHLFATDGGGFSIETVRRIRRRISAPEQIGARHDTLSAGGATFRYATAMGAGDSLSFGLVAGIEKRRFALDLTHGHHVRSQSVGLVADWVHGWAWQLESGYRFDFGSRSAPMLERGIELAEGAQRSQRGLWTNLSYRLGGGNATNSLSLGLRAQAFRLTRSDGLALGGASRTDNRLALTTTFRFR